MQQEERCGTCKFYVPDANNLKGPGNCRRDPPTAFMIMGQNPRTQQPQPMFLSADPAVNASDRRHCWKAKFDFDNNGPLPLAGKGETVDFNA